MSAYEDAFGPGETARIQPQVPGADPPPVPLDDRFAQDVNRSAVLLRLPLNVVHPFIQAGGAQALRDFVARMMWDHPGGQTLTEIQTCDLIRLLGAGASPLTGAQMDQWVTFLAGLTPQRVAALFQNLFDNVGTLVARATRYAELRPWLDGATPMTAVQFEDMITRLRSGPQVAETYLRRPELYEIFDELRSAYANNGVRAHQLVTWLCHTAPPGGITGLQFHELIKWLRNAPTHTNALTGDQIDEVVQDFRTNPGGTAPNQATGYEIFAMARAAKNAVPPAAITAAEFRTLILALRLNRLPFLHPKNLYDLIVCAGHQDQGINPIKPRWLFEAASAVATGPLFVQRLNHCVPLARDFPGLRALLVRISRVFLPTWALNFLNIFAALTDAPKHKQDRVRDFLTASTAVVVGGTATWPTIQLHLDRFVTAGRAPHGANQTKFANVGFGGGLAGQVIGPVPINGTATPVTVTVSNHRLNYFCNAHTYRHCDFTERLDRHAVPIFDFFPATDGRAEVLAACTAIPITVLTSRSDVTLRHGNKEFVVSGNTIVHFSSTGGIRIHWRILTALSHLFDN